MAHSLLEIITNSDEFPKFIIYDNACHLAEFIKSRSISQYSIRGKILEESTFVIDRLHIKNHVRDECHKFYNVDLHNELYEINTVVCEELNFWLGSYKYAMKHMNYSSFNFFLYIILEDYNEEKLKLNAIKKYKKKKQTFFN